MAISGIASPVAGTIITTAFVDLNYKTPLLYLLQYFGADPTNANQWLQTNGSGATATASWVDRATAVLAAIATHSLDGDTKLIANSVNGPGAIGSVHGNVITAATIPDSAHAANSISAASIAPNAVGSSELADDAVDTAAIVNAAVTAPKLAAGVAAPPLAGLAARGTTLSLSTSYQDVPSATVTATATGVYILLASVRFNSVSTDGNNRAKLQVNGVDHTGIELVGSVGIAEMNHPSGFTIATITSGQVVKMQAKKDSGSGGSSVDDAYLAIFRIT